MRLILAAAVVAALLPSCAQEKQPVPPTTGSTTRPWNPPQPGQGAGALGVIPQQPRR